MSRRLLGVIVVIVAAIGFLVVKGLGDATTYFRNVDEAVAARGELGTRRFRLQGTVVEGSLVRGPGGDEFEVAYNCSTVRVRHTGPQAPERFDEGIPVVLEGRFAERSALYRSDTIIVKHTSEYATEKRDRLDRAAEESGSEACPTSNAAAASR